MKHTLILLSFRLGCLCLLTVAICISIASAEDKPNLQTYPPRDTYERQLQDYQRHGYDSGRNGSLRQESNIQRENDSYQRQEQHRQDTTPNNTWGSRDNTGGYTGGQCLYGC